MKTDLVHFIGADVHKSTTTFTVLNREQNVMDVACIPTRIPLLRTYLEGIQGPKGLIFEEMGLSQWLYAMLRPCVDECIVCDPYRNHLLKEGAKTDPIDSQKLATLYLHQLIKPIFHSTHRLMDLRNQVHVYQETVRASVRAQNQYEAYLAKNGIDTKSKTFCDTLDLQLQREHIVFLERQKRKILEQWKCKRKTIPQIALLTSIEGIGLVGAFIILAAVVDPKRFSSKHAFWSYCGLAKHPRQSGERIYGYTNTRYHRDLKNVFKRAAVISIGMKNGILRKVYDQLRKQGIAEHNARNAIARKIAAISLACLKQKRRFDPNQLI